MLVGLAMAGKRSFTNNVLLYPNHRIPEVCSAHPTSGGPYFWAAMLSPPEYAAFASWITGWFNLLGQVAVTTGIRFVLYFRETESNLQVLMRTYCAPPLQQFRCGDVHLDRRDTRYRF